MVRVWRSSSSPEARRRREPSQFPKDMLYPCPTGRNNRTGALASRGDPKARVWRPVQEVGTDYCTHTSQRKTVTTHIPFGWHYTAWPLQQTETSPRPTPAIRKIPGGREAGNRCKRLWLTTLMVIDTCVETWCDKWHVWKHENYTSEHLLYLPSINPCKYYPCHSTLFQFYLFCKLH